MCLKRSIIYFFESKKFELFFNLLLCFFYFVAPFIFIPGGYFSSISSIYSMLLGYFLFIIILAYDNLDQMNRIKSSYHLILCLVVFVSAFNNLTWVKEEIIFDVPSHIESAKRNTRDFIIKHPGYYKDNPEEKLKDELRLKFSYLSMEFRVGLKDLYLDYINKNIEIDNGEKYYSSNIEYYFIMVLVALIALITLIKDIIERPAYRKYVFGS